MALLGILAAVAGIIVLAWWINVGSARRHMRRAIRETEIELGLRRNGRLK